MKSYLMLGAGIIVIGGGTAYYMSKSNQGSGMLDLMPMTGGNGGGLMELMPMDNSSGGGLMELQPETIIHPYPGWTYADSYVAGDVSLCPDYFDAGSPDTSCVCTPDKLKLEFYVAENDRWYASCGNGSEAAAVEYKYGLDDSMVYYTY